MRNELNTLTMILYSLLGITMAFVISCPIQIIRFYDSAKKEQSEYEQLKLEAFSDSSEYENDDSEVLSQEQSDNENVEDNTEDEEEYSFQMISTSNSSQTQKRKGLISLLPVNDPTSGATVMLRQTKQEEETTKPAKKKLKITKSTTGMRIDWPKLREINADAIGWMRIEGTIIDYPVVQADDNEYYLRHSFRQAETSAGCLFADYSNSLGEDKNIVIYGHNLGKTSKTMFTSLLNYYDPSYFQAHRYILFDTIYGSAKWEIVSVYKFDVNNINEYNYTQQEFASKTEYKQFLKKTKELSLYDTGVTVTYEDEILTLSTCDREMYGKTGRCVIVAKKIY